MVHPSLLSLVVKVIQREGLPQKSLQVLLVWEGGAPALRLSFALQTVKVSFAPFGAG